MRNELVYDIYSMKSAEREALGLLGSIRAQLRLLEERTDAGLYAAKRVSAADYAPGRDDSALEDEHLPDRIAVKNGLQELSGICRGYESLIYRLEAAANIYGAAEVSAEELAVF